MPPDNEDLTSRRVSAKWKAFLSEFEPIYQRATVKPTFWASWDAEEPQLIEKLRKRPLPLLDIENLFSAFRAKMLKAL